MTAPDTETFDRWLDECGTAAAVLGRSPRWSAQRDQALAELATWFAAVDAALDRATSRAYLLGLVTAVDLAGFLSRAELQRQAALLAAVLNDYTAKAGEGNTDAGT